MHACRTALQSRSQSSAGRRESRGWVKAVGEKSHNCTGEIRNKPPEKKAPWNISCPAGTLIASELQHGQITLQSRAQAGHNPPEADVPCLQDTPNLIPSVC